MQCHLHLNMMAGSWISLLEKKRLGHGRWLSTGTTACMQPTVLLHHLGQGLVLTWFPGWLVGILVALTDELVTSCETGAHSLTGFIVAPLSGAATAGRDDFAGILRMAWGSYNRVLPWLSCPGFCLSVLSWTHAGMNGVYCIHWESSWS